MHGASRKKKIAQHLFQTPHPISEHLKNLHRKK